MTLIAVPDELAATFSGQLLAEGDAGYDEVRSIHNGLIDKRPALIARCANTADVRDAVNLGREAGAEISVRGGGHNVAGKAVTDGGLMIDLSLMRGIHVDEAARTIRAQTGLSWNELNRAAAVKGLATTGGAISTTGVAGLTLGGGIGFLQGKFGIAVDNLLSAEIVTADGEVRTVSDDNDPDLFWAIRGAGANFGVATSLEFRAHPLTTVLGGLVAHHLAAAPAVFAHWRTFTKSLPDELVTFCGMVHAPDGSGTKIVGMPICHCGNLVKAEAEVAPLREFGPPIMDMVSPMPYPVVNTLLDDAFPKGARNYWKSAFLTELTDAAVQTMIDAFEAAPSIMNGMILECFSGAVTRIDPTATAYPHREPGYNLVIAAEWLDPAEDKANIAWARETYAALQPYMAPRSYVNYMAADDAGQVREAYGPNYERLLELKRRYDPTNLFRLNQNIDPAGHAA